MKNILIDIGHPAHVHLFRNLHKELTSSGFSVMVTIKDVPIIKQLLTVYGIPFQIIGTKSDSLFGKFFDQIRFGWRMWRIVMRNKIHIAIGTSITIAHVSRFSKMTSFVFDDDDSEVQPLMARFGHPFADYIVSPDVLSHERKGKNAIVYPGYHELAYLHPSHFTPDKSVLAEHGIRENEVFFVMRFNAFRAHHDVGVNGLSIEQKRELIEILKPHGKVIITTEKEIDKEFQPFQIMVSPEKAHSLLAFAHIFLGDSQTMTSEAAMLGVPSLRCNSLAKRISYLNEQENRFGLTKAFHPKDFEQLKKQLIEWMEMPDLKGKWRIKRDAMLKKKINVSHFQYQLLAQFAREAKVEVDKIITNV